MKRRRFTAAVLVFSVLAGAGWVLLAGKERSDAERGEEIAREKGCFGCHGQGGVDGINNPGSTGGAIFGWSNGGMDMYVRSEEDIREWILYGSPRKDSVKAARLKPNNLISMPAYDGYISDPELDALVVYFRAVSGWDPDMPDTEYEGWKIANRLGCFGCHGPSGRGGVSNPGSFKGYIPSWTGKEFAELVRSDEELSDWILKGKISRLTNDLAASFFLERQKIGMPAYDRYLTEDELKKIIAYIHWLRKTRV